MRRWIPERMPARCALLVLLIGLGCAPPEDAPSGPPTVAVTHPVLAAIIRPMLRDGVELTEPAIDARGPTRETVSALLAADLVIGVGGNVEPWMATAVLPRDRLLDVTAALPAVEVDGPAHRHGTEGSHVHKEHDGYFWIDPLRMQAAIDVIVEALREHSLLGTQPPDADPMLRDAEARLAVLAQRSIDVAAPARGYSGLIERMGWRRVAPGTEAQVELTTEMLEVSGDAEPLVAIARLLDILERELADAPPSE